jgi:hypothetical protein
MLNFAQDHAVFFNEDHFAQPAVWQDQTINVIFDKNYTEQFGIANNNPVMRAPEASFAGIAREQAVVVNGTNYKVQSFEPDGRGLILIQLVLA